MLFEQHLKVSCFLSRTQSGLHVTVGDDMGRIWVYDVGEALAIPGQDEWSKFAHTLVDIKQNKIDQVFECYFSANET